MKKILVIISLLLLVAIFLTSCESFSYMIGWRFDNQENTTWVSEDGKIVIYIGRSLSDNPPYASIKLENGKIMEFYPLMGGGDILLESNDSGDICEEWMTSRIRPNSFVATVLKTTFFEVGQKIKFHKVDE